MKENIQSKGSEAYHLFYGFNSRLFLILIMISFGAGTIMAQTGIEGKWNTNKEGGIILIYEEDGKYYGQLISTDNPENNKKIEAHGEKIILMKDFEKKNDTEFCCGTIYQPKFKRELTASLTLMNENTLKINAKYKMFKGTQEWTRLQ